MKYLEYRIEEGVGTLAFNRPEKYHAFNEELLSELCRVLDREAGNPELQLLVITGSGNKSFSSGVDLKFLRKLKNVEEARNFALLLEETSEKIFNFPKPTLAAINGIALGGGFGFATAADIRVIKEGAKVGYPAVKLGAILPATCTLYLTALIGAGKAKDLLLTGKIIEAKEAHTLGLVQYISGEKEWNPFIKKLARQIMEGGSTALYYTKKTVNYSLKKELEAAKLYAADNFAFLSQTEEWKKRLSEFGGG